jgi:hypothetical protein
MQSPYPGGSWQSFYAVLDDEELAEQVDALVHRLDDRLHDADRVLLKELCRRIHQLEVIQADLLERHLRKEEEGR